MDLIGKIHLESSKGHSFILVPMDYFTKWLEVVPLKKAEQKDIIRFIKENIIHLFRMPQSITTRNYVHWGGNEVLCNRLWNSIYVFHVVLCLG